MSNKKQKARFSITEITDKDFRKLLKMFKNSPYIGYKSKQVLNKPTKAYFFLIKKITRQIKSKRQVWIRTKFFKLGVNKTIVQINGKIGNVNEAIKFEELEGNNKMPTCADKDKQTLSPYDIKDKEKTSRTSKNKE